MKLPSWLQSKKNSKEPLGHDAAARKRAAHALADEVARDPLAGAAAIIAAVRLALRQEKPSLAWVKVLANPVSIYFNAGKWAELSEALKFQLDVFENVEFDGRDHTRGFDSMVQIFVDAKRDDEVLALLETIARVRGKTLGETHIGAVVARADLAEAQWRKKVLDRAASLINACITSFDAFAKENPDDDQVVKLGRARLHTIAGLIDLDQRNATSGVEHLALAASIFDEYPDQDITKLLSAKLNLARGLFAVDRAQEAVEILTPTVARIESLERLENERVKHFRDVIEQIFSELSGRDYSELAAQVGSVLNRLTAESGTQDEFQQHLVLMSRAKTLKQAGRLEEAAAIYDELIRATEKIDNDDGRKNLAFALDNALGLFAIQSHLRQQNFDLTSDSGARRIGPFEEDELAARTEVAFKRAFPRLHLHTAQFYGGRGVRLSMAGKVAEAQEAFEECFSIIERLDQGDQHVRHLLQVMTVERNNMRAIHDLAPDDRDPLPAIEAVDREIAATEGEYSTRRINQLTLSAAHLFQAGDVRSISLLRKAATAAEGRLRLLASVGATALRDRERSEAKSVTKAFLGYFMMLGMETLRTTNSDESSDTRANRTREAFHFGQLAMASTAASAFEHSRNVDAVSQARVVLADPVAIETVQATLHPNEVLVMIPGGENLSAMIVSHNNSELINTPVSEISLRFRLQVGNRLGDVFSNDDPFSIFSLSLILIPRLAPWIAAAHHIIFVVGGALAELPLTLLRWSPEPPEPGARSAERPRTAPYLIDRCAISIVPSVKALIDLRGRKQSQSGGRAFLGIADPILGTSPADNESDDPFHAIFQRMGPEGDRLERLREMPETASMVHGIANTLG